MAASSVAQAECVRIIVLTMLSHLGKFLIFAGLLLLVVGIIFWFASKVPGWEKFWVGRLPGDIYISRGNFKFYFPITTCVLISLLLTLIFWLIGRFRG